MTIRLASSVLSSVAEIGSTAGSAGPAGALGMIRWHHLWVGFEYGMKVAAHVHDRVDVPLVTDNAGQASILPPQQDCALMSVGSGANARRRTEAISSPPVVR